MGRSSIPPALLELSNPSTPEAQVNALRSLKNEIVGHDQRKELAVLHGVVRPLAGILKAEARRGGKRRRSVMNGNAGAGKERDGTAAWSIEDELRFQATLVVGSLVNGGPAFVAPLLAGPILPPLLDALSPLETPSKLVVATLRTLNQVADAITLEKPWTDSADGPVPSSLTTTVTEHIYTKSVMQSFAEILTQKPRSSSVQQQISLTTKLIVKTCKEEGHRKMLLEAHILDLLAHKLAAIARVDARSLTRDTRHSASDEYPLASLNDILEAVAVIVQDSHYNTARFLYSESIQQLFGSPKDNPATYDAYTSPPQTVPWDRLIPRLQTIQSKSDAYTKSWPPLGGDNYTRLPSMEPLQPTGRTVIADEAENSLFIWLIYVARRAEGKERLSACWLLALLKKFGEKWPLNDPSKTTRERHFSYLVLPLIVKMISESNPADQAKRANLSLQAKEENKLMLERAPLVLAELVAGNKNLQNAAMETNILPLLVQILKRSFDPINALSKPLWAPRPASPQIQDPLIDPTSSTLGRAGLTAEVLHAFRYRESILYALAAIAGTQDMLRKQVIEHGTTSFIIDSLIPYADGLNDSSSSTQTGGSTTPKDGNPVPVLIAACKVARSLSRSISVLRTSLIDHGIAKPSFDLLTHPNVKVQIAATDVITNLVLEVSPMRTEIIEAGALKTLCEHCRSANFDLRCGSLWALKHLVLGLTLPMKVQCLEELGVGYLVQTLNGEPTKSAVSSPLGMGTPNAVGEQVDILNAVDDPSMDVDDDISSVEDEDTMADSIPSMRRHQRQGSRYTSSNSIRDRLQQIKNDEHDPRLTNERDDVRIQEQALDFIRNFIMDDKASGETIDHILKTFGHSRFFDLMVSKLRPKSSSHPSNPAPTPTHPVPNYWTNPSRPSFTTTTSAVASSTPINWTPYPAPELITGTLYILVHLANGRTQHRSLLISQSSLMNHLLPLFAHPTRSVRLPCAWILNNLTWVDDNADLVASRERAQQLRQLGFEEGVKRLAQDLDLDIKERAKTAIEQMGKLLGEDGGGVAARAAAAAAGGGSGYASPSHASLFSTGGGGGEAGGLGGRSGLGGLHSHRGWGRDGSG
ncbi:armadillo repeat domain-containing protein [Polyplosphaeria fusca]|uniref:Armadillo repeat domain-containing protein n=1 Tax=Polyplosphaeria fusca TaxID=682080 RepID=A0A9P4QWK5_9PLEO|nr:armadillo repeat domain-containing protein [Polyplosphaeria fusca]